MLYNNTNDYTLFIEELKKMLNDIVSSENLPDHSLYLYSNISSKGENAGKETSKSICIFEPPYPPKKEISKPEGKNFIVMNFKPVSKSGIELLIRNKQFDVLEIPDCAEIKTVKSDTSFKHVIFHSFSSDLLSYIRKNIYYSLNHYQSNSSFGCCSRFVKCSDNKGCVHPNKLYAKGCKYRSFLDEGKIFYGKNRNI